MQDTLRGRFCKRAPRVPGIYARSPDPDSNPDFRFILIRKQFKLFTDLPLHSNAYKISVSTPIWSAQVSLDSLSRNLRSDIVFTYVNSF